MAQEVRLLINIVSAHGLRNAAPDLFQKTIVEPYCICEIMGREDPNAPTFRTKSRPNGDAPLWNEVTQIVIEQGEALIFMVNYKDDDSEGDVIGWAKLEFGTMLPHGFKGELNLTDAAASKVLPAFLQVDVKPIPFQEDLEDLEAQPASPEPPPLAPMSSHFAEDPSLPQDDATADLEKEVPETQERMLPGHTDDTGDAEQRHLLAKTSPASKKSSGGAGKPPPPKPEDPGLPPLVPKELTEETKQAVNAIDALLNRKKRPLRQSLEEALDTRHSLVAADTNDEGKLSSFGQKADEGPRSFGQVLAQAWTGNAGRSPSPTAHVLPWPSHEVSHREVPGLGTLGKALAARVRGLLLHLERTVAIDPDISAADLLQQQDVITEADKIEANLEASGLGKFPPPLMVAGSVEPLPLSTTAISSDEDAPSKPWPRRSSAKENRSKVRGCTVQIAGQTRSTDAGFGAHPECRIVSLQAKFEEAHGSLSAAFAAMDLESRGCVSFGDFHSHLVRLRLSSVDAEGSARTMELFKLLDTDGDDLLSPRDCLKAFKGAAMLMKERADNFVHQEKLKTFLREHGLPSDMRIPRHKPLGGDQYSRAVSLQRYLVLKYGSLYEAVQSMDSSGIGFVNKNDFVQHLLSDGYCYSEFEAEELFQSFDPWCKGWLPLQRMLEYEVSGVEWLRPWVNAAASEGTSPRASPRASSRASPRSTPCGASGRARRSPANSPDQTARSPRSIPGQSSPLREEETGFLFSDPGRLDAAPPSSPRRQLSRSPKRSPRSTSPVHERLHIAGIGHKRVLPGDSDAIRTAYHNLEQAKSLMDEMNRKAKERAAAAMKAVDEARERAQAAKVAADSGVVPPELQAPGPIERFQASRPGAASVPTINLAGMRAEPKQNTESPEDRADSVAFSATPTPQSTTPVTTPREAEARERVSAVKAMASAASVASAQSGESRSALQQRRKAREQRRKELMKVMDADGDGVITKSELDQLKAANPELSQVDMSKLDADGDGQISKEELEKALDAEVEPQAEAASILSAVANLFGSSQASDEKKEEPSEDRAKLDEADKESTPAPKAKALPKALFAMTRVNFVAGRKGSLAPSADDSQGQASSQASAARKRREVRKAGKALLAVASLKEDGNTRG